MRVVFKINLIFMGETPWRSDENPEGRNEYISRVVTKLENEILGVTLSEEEKKRLYELDDVQVRGDRISLKDKAGNNWYGEIKVEMGEEKFFCYKEGEETAGGVIE